jgi:hypothetical protein
MNKHPQNQEKSLLAIVINSLPVMTVLARHCVPYGTSARPKAISQVCNSTDKERTQ